MSQSYGLGKIMNGMRSAMRSESAGCLKESGKIMCLEMRSGMSEESGIDVPESVSLNSES